MMRGRDCKAEARQLLKGRYGALIAAYFLSGFISFLCLMICAAALAAALLNAGIGLSYAVLRFPGFVPVPQMVWLWVCVFTACLMLTVLVGLFFRIGRRYMILHIARGGYAPVSDVFYGFRKGSGVWSVIGSYILRFLLLTVFSVIPAVCGVIIKLTGMETAAFGTGFLINAGVRAVCGIISLILVLTYCFCDLPILEKPWLKAGNGMRQSKERMRGKKGRFLLLELSFIPWALLALFVPLTSLWIRPYIEGTEAVFYLRTGDYADPLCKSTEPGQVPDGDCGSGFEDDLCDEPAE